MEPAPRWPWVSLAHCTWTLWHLRSQHRRGRTAPLCLGRRWATFPSPRGSLRLGVGGAAETRMHRLRQETSIHGAASSRGRDRRQPAPLPAAMGFGVIPPCPWPPQGTDVGAHWQGEFLGTLPSCQAPARDCSKVGWAELGVHPWVQMPGSRMVVSWVGSAGAWGRRGDTRVICPQSPAEPPHRGWESSRWDGCRVPQFPVRHLVPHRAEPGMPGRSGGAGSETWGPAGWWVLAVAPSWRLRAGERKQWRATPARAGR